MDGDEPHRVEDEVGEGGHEGSQGEGQQPQGAEGEGEQQQATEVEAPPPPRPRPANDIRAKRLARLQNTPSKRADLQADDKKDASAKQEEANNPFLSLTQDSPKMSRAAAKRPAPSKGVAATPSLESSKDLEAPAPGKKPSSTLSLDRASTSSPSKGSNQLYEYAHDYARGVLQVEYLDKGDIGFGQMRLSGSSSRGEARAISCPHLLKEFQDDPDLDARQFVDTLLMAHLTSEERGIPKSIAYLSQAFARASERLRVMPTKSRLRPVAELVLQLTTSYAHTILSLDEAMFPVDSETKDAKQWVVQSLLQSTDVRPFLSRIVDVCMEEDPGSIASVFLPVLSKLCDLARQATDLQHALPILQAFQSCCSLGTVQKGKPLPVAHALVMHDNFLPESDNAAAIAHTPLGVLLQPGVIPQETHPLQLRRPRFSAASMFHVRERRLPPSVVESTQSTLRASLALYRRHLLETCKCFLKTGEERDRVFMFFKSVFAANARRAQLGSQLAAMPQVMQQTNDDNFMMNVGVLMRQLSHKLLSFDEVRLKTRATDFDIRFLVAPKCPFNADKETRLGATEEEAKKWMKETREELKNNPLPDKTQMMSRQFFSTLHAMHLGLLPAIARLNAIYLSGRSRLAFIDRQRAAAEQRGQDNPRLVAEVDRLIAERCAFEADICNEEQLSELIELYGFVAAWLLQVVGGLRTIPLPADVPSTWVYMPEYFAYDVIEFFLFVSRAAPHLFTSTAATPFITRFFVAFLDSSKHIKIASERAKIIEILSNMLPDRAPTATLLMALLQTDLGMNHLGPALMKFYVDAEEIDYYSRPGVRYNLQLILKTMWENPKSREAIIRSTRDDGFVRFVMLLINDTTLFFDEVFDCLLKIKDLKRRLAQQEWNDPDQTREEAEAELPKLENQTKTLSMLAGETLHFFNNLSGAVVDPFLRPEVVGRLAGMLNSNIRWLFGPQASNMELDQLREYDFNPIAILRQLVAIYLHCSRIPTAGPANADEKFVKAVVEDARYDHSLLKKALATLERNSSAYDEVKQFRQLIDVAKQTYDRLQSEEADLGDIPDKYLDPVMYTLMRDPVQLPSSKTIMDRSVIIQHLLSDPTDPFSRSKLSTDELVPLPELKAEIEDWLASRKKTKPQAEAASGGGDKP